MHSAMLTTTVSVITLRHHATLFHTVDRSPLCCTLIAMTYKAGQFGREREVAQQQ